MLKKFLSGERGATELTSQIFILLGVATIIAALIIIFRTQLTEIVNNMFANFGTRSGSTW
jgi:Flp pilus assembly pilin Flp